MKRLASMLLAVTLASSCFGKITEEMQKDREMVRMRHCETDETRHTDPDTGEVVVKHTEVTCAEWKDPKKAHPELTR